MLHDAVLFFVGISWVSVLRLPLVTGIQDADPRPAWLSLFDQCRLCVILLVYVRFTSHSERVVPYHRAVVIQYMEQGSHCLRYFAAQAVWSYS